MENFRAATRDAARFWGGPDEREAAGFGEDCASMKLFAQKKQRVCGGSVLP